MGVNYQPVLWNRNKKIYDKWIAISMLIYLVSFIGVTILTNSETSAETLIIRAFGTLAIALLHIILAIGPLARINTRFLPLLYNRRHLGVSMFLAALVHGGFSIFQFHSLGNVNPIYAVFTSNMDYGSIANFPFQVLGFLALIILFLMAATSHDFWLKNLSPKTWKRLHMMVYFAYSLIILHVFLGAFQQQPSLWSIAVLSIGFLTIAGLHITTAIKETKVDKSKTEQVEDGWEYVCDIDEIPEDRAKIFIVDKERIAVFKYDNKLSAISNVCKHQGGPLGEGKVIDGCVTCPWHGYQYLPHNGQSPPPFTEKVATYRLKNKNNKIYVLPEALAEGTEVEPVTF
ncbi:Rieske 2Fe-2S domain-containing protein [Aquimarina sp. 2201CG5-10]|uniref:Rieske 2Fe-2S domain-containing protein n=1 Tax=Aquimarina callyspongiae TaxID=3098150 RepID=UPI002AB44DEE|nr:Rieske 2Fe-2S domain-containing protein [Aquimarina sp. 2201CG5-10]MDY8134552.1 ferric reductase-like transmembrane domain-containing protein [Aquimarina sp. 2201CG5-10]